jgi:hypothetical protein
MPARRRRRDLLAWRCDARGHSALPLGHDPGVRAGDGALRQRGRRGLHGAGRLVGLVPGVLVDHRAGLNRGHLARTRRPGRGPLPRRARDGVGPRRRRARHRGWQRGAAPAVAAAVWAVLPGRTRRLPPARRGRLRVYVDSVVWSGPAGVRRGATGHLLRRVPDAGRPTRRGRLAPRGQPCGAWGLHGAVAGWLGVLSGDVVVTHPLRGPHGA